MSDSSSQHTLLIVDDEPTMLMFVNKVLQPMGYATYTAQSGEDALKFLEELPGKVDVLILDLVLPGMGGIETIKAVREKHKDLPIIVISGMVNQKEKCLSLGAAFLDKPFGLEDLIHKIESVLGISSEKQADEQSSAAHPSAKLLIVDDEPEVCHLIAEALFEEFEEADFKVRAAHSGEKALELTKEFEPDIAIVDIKMPKMSGTELIGRLKSGEGYCPRDFVIYTGVTDEEVLGPAKNLGHQVLTKPTNIETLYTVLKRICIRHNLVQKA